MAKIPQGAIGVYNMGMSTTNFHDMSVEDKLRLVTQLWDDIASSPEPIVVPPDIIREASRRSAELTENPSLGIDDDELWHRVDG